MSSQISARFAQKTLGKFCNYAKYGGSKCKKTQTGSDWNADSCVASRFSRRIQWRIQKLQKRTFKILSRSVHTNCALIYVHEFRNSETQLRLYQTTIPTIKPCLNFVIHYLVLIQVSWVKITIFPLGQKMGSYILKPLI